MLPGIVHRDLAPDPDLDRQRPPPELVARAAADGATVRVSGTIRSLQSGAGMYGKLILYDEATERVAGLVYSTSAGAWTAEVPPGTYGLYVRSFGHLPVLIEHVSVAATMTLDPIIDTLASRATPAYLKQSTLAEPIVFADGLDASTMLLTSTKDMGPSVQLLNEFGRLTADGAAVGLVDLYDDGSHGDAVAGDGVYTRHGIGLGAATPNWGGRADSDLLLYIRVPGGVPPLVSIPSLTLIALSPGQRVEAVTLAGGAQHTRNAANIIADTSTPNFNWEQEAARTFFRSFADVYDFLYMFPATGMGDYAGLSGVVFNDATGIGRGPSDVRALFGSTRLVNRMIIKPALTMPLLHETMHHWGAAMDALFHTNSYGNHWGYAGVNGQLGGFDPGKLRDNGDGTWATGEVAPYGSASDTRPYGPLELYIAGMVDTLDELEGIPVLVNPDLQLAWTRVAADRIDHVAAADIIATYGPRNPPPVASQHRFNAAFCWVSQHPLNAAAMSYLDLVARIFSGQVTVPMTHSFASATRGVGSVDVRIRRAPRLHRTVPKAP